MMRSGVVRAMFVWILLSVIGAAVVAVPDDDARVFSLSETHGPSALDLVGVVVLLAGWTIFLSALWRVRWVLRPHLVPAAAGALAGGVVVVWSVVADTGAWWVLGAGVLLVIQIWLGVSAARAVRGRAAPP